MSEAELARLSRQLADIDMPAEPADHWLLYLGLAVVLAVAITTAQMLRRRRHNQSQAPRPANDKLLEKLAQLEADWQAHRIDDQTTAFRLATLIRLALRINHLEPSPPPGVAIDPEQWRKLHQRLHELRYRAGAASAGQAVDPALFRQIGAIIEGARP